MSLKIQRIVLDDKANESLLDMTEKIKAEGNFVKINPSRLASWIIEQFANLYFQEMKPQIIQAYFDSKEFLKTIASKIDGKQDAEKILIEALNRIQTGNKKLYHAPKTKTEKINQKSKPEGI